MERNIIRVILTLLAFGSFYVMAFQEPTKTTIFTGSTIPVGRMMLPLGQVDYANYTTVTNQIYKVPISSASDKDGNNALPIAPPTMTFATIPTTPSGTDCFEYGGNNTGGLKYICANTKWFHVAFSVSGRTEGSANDMFVLTPAVNGTNVSGCKAYITSSNNIVGSTSLHCVVPLDPASTNTLTLKVGNMTDDDDFIVYALNIQAVGM
jgi:hypothetical protein